MKKVKEGYKMTEIWEIPEEWEVVKLENITKICYGKSQKEIEVEDGKYSILGTGGIMGRTNDFLWNKPSVLIGRKGTIDKPQYIEEPFWTVDTLFYTKINEEFTAKWLFYYLNNIDLKKYNEATGVPSLSVSVLNNIKIITPPLKEQQKIVSILSSVDEQIEINDNLIEKTKELKKGLMQKLLTKGIGHERFKDTEIGRIPEEWEVKKLGDVLIKGPQNGMYKNKDDLSGTCDCRVVELIDLYSNYKYINCKKLNDIDLTDREINLYKLEKNDLLVNRVSKAVDGVARMMIFGGNDVDTCFESNMMRITLDSNVINDEYLFFLSCAEIFRNEVMKVAKVSNQTSISQDGLKNINIAVPLVKEQQKIASILSSVDNQIEEYQSKKEKLEELKKGLMQKLLSGKVRVKI